jgi:hypothetical protein
LKRPGAKERRGADDDDERSANAAHESLIDNKQFGAALRQRAVCPCIVGHLVALAGLERHRAAVLEFGDQLAVKDQQDVAFVAPVIGEVVLRILDHAHAQFAELPGAPIGDAGLAGMLRPLDLRPVRRAERDIGHFHGASIPVLLHPQC